MLLKRIVKRARLKKRELKQPFSKVSDYRDILAITEGHNWKPVTRKGRFINANCPPEDLSQEELESIWGDPEDALPLRDMRIKPLPKEKRKHKFKPSPV